MRSARSSEFQRSELLENCETKPTRTRNPELGTAFENYQTNPPGMDGRFQISDLRGREMIRKTTKRSHWPIRNRRPIRASYVTTDTYGRITKRTHLAGIADFRWSRARGSQTAATANRSRSNAPRSVRNLPNEPIYKNEADRCWRVEPRMKRKLELRIRVSSVFHLWPQIVTTELPNEPNLPTSLAPSTSRVPFWHLEDTFARLSRYEHSSI